MDSFRLRAAGLYLYGRDGTVSRTVLFGVSDPGGVSFDEKMEENSAGRSLLRAGGFIICNLFALEGEQCGRIF